MQRWEAGLGLGLGPGLVSRWRDIASGGERTSSGLRSRQSGAWCGLSGSSTGAEPNHPAVNSCHLKRLSISYVVTRSRPYLALALALSAGLSFLHITRFESDLGAVNFAIDLVITVDEADILGLGAALERASATA